MSTSNSNSNTSSSIEERLAMLESNKKFEATKEAIKEREVEFLAQLRLIESEMTMTATSANNGGGGSTTTSTASNIAKGGMEQQQQQQQQQQQLKVENERLKALVAKQSFRIKHLVDEMEKKQIYKQQQQQQQR
mmetsp:Transcript_24829/g.58929  ORF Transcript_24829/g.58929 Transcript_24829/m.58929 type:complete len:134 (+) Transcript_24829:139-540(+)